MNRGQAEMAGHFRNERRRKRQRDADTQRLAPELTSYAVHTRIAFVDLLLAPLLLPLTATSRTVTVRT